MTAEAPEITLPEAEQLMRDALDVGDFMKIEVARLKVANAVPEPVEPSILGAALYYATQGLHVFPLQPSSKIPWPKSHGFEDATTDHTRIRSWFGPGKAPSNLGIATGHGVDVIDIDGLAGQRSRLDNWDLFTEFDVIAVVSTPRAGGLHLFVPATGEGNSAAIFPGIDYRGLGGYVVAPPSTTPDGTYRFLRPPNPARLKELTR